MARNQLPGRRTVAIILAFALVGLGTPAGAGGTTPPRLSAHKVSVLRSAQTPDGEAVIVSANMELGVARPKRVLTPFYAFEMGGGRPVTLKTVRISGPDGHVRAAVHPDARLKAASASSTEEVLSLLAGEDEQRAAGLIERGLVTYLPVPIEDLALDDGSTTVLTATAVFDVGGQSLQAVLPIEISISSLPVQSEWGAGDGHVHSNTWSVGSYTVAERASQAVSGGLKWLIMTDHWNYIQERPTDDLVDWQLYAQDCANQEVAFGLPVLPGLEIAAIGNASHNLAYGLDTSKLPPGDELYPAAQLLDLINAHNPPSSFGVAAHPYRSGLPYQDFSADFRALELMSQATTASASTITKWFELLNASVSRRIAGGYFTVGVANTDAHTEHPGAAGVTWIRSASGFTRTSVLDAIKSGAASASGRGDLGYFTLNGVEQGGVAPVYPATTLNLEISQLPRTGRKCTLISVRDRNNNQVWSVANPTETTYTATVARPTNDTFRLVKMTFANTDGTDVSDVWCNPVFIDMRTNQAPLAGTDSYDAVEDTALALAAPGVLANDTDPDGDALSVALATPPAHGTVSLSPAGGFTFTPAADYNGPDAFTYTVSDGAGGTATGTVSIAVAPVNDAPLAPGTSVTTPEDTPLEITLPASDVDGDALSFGVGSPPAHGSLGPVLSGKVTFTPAAGYDGPDAFTYTVSDGAGGTATGTVTLDVTNVWTRFEQTDRAIAWRGAWKTASSAGFSGGSARYARNSGARATIAFEGTAVRIVGAIYPSGGLARVTIDGGTPQVVDLAGGDDATLYRQVVFARYGLSSGPHTMTIEILRNKGNRRRVYVDAVDVAGTLGAARKAGLASHGSSRRAGSRRR